MTADLTRERLERMRDGYTATGIWTPDDMDALLAHALSEPARIAAARVLLATTPALLEAHDLAERVAALETAMPAPDARRPGGPGKL